MPFCLRLMFQQLCLRSSLLDVFFWEFHAELHALFLGMKYVALVTCKVLNFFLCLLAKFVFCVCVSIVFWFLLTCTYCVFYLNKGW